MMQQRVAIGQPAAYKAAEVLGCDLAACSKIDWRASCKRITYARLEHVDKT